MRYLILLFLFPLLLIAGCTAPTEPVSSSQNSSAHSSSIQNNNTTNSVDNCIEFCTSLARPSCIGNWTVSGTYPDCKCSFECDESIPHGESGETNRTSQNSTSESSSSNTSTEIDEHLSPSTNKSVSQLLTESLDKQHSAFYSTHEGSFNQKAYTWLRQMPPSGGIVFDAAPASDITFDGIVIPSVQASGFVIFRNTADESESIFGVAIFKDKRTMLDNYTGSDAFDIVYFPKMIDKNLHDCWVYSKDYNIDMDGIWFLTYYFECAAAVDKTDPEED